MPYVIISVPIDELNVLSTNAAHDITLPAIQTARQPYLLASADTTGPVGKKFKQRNREEIDDVLVWWKDLDA